MKNRKRVVVKVGTKVITSGDRALDIERVKGLVSQIASIRDKGIDVILITSGAIGAGLWLLGMKKRPEDLAMLQASAAIGQNHLMHLYSEFFKNFKTNVGQILLTQEDFNDRTRYLNIKHTIEALLEHGAVPIINENDTVATEEIRCGDNDRLSSLVADLCGAYKLILLTDVDGLLGADGKVINFVSEITHDIAKLGGKSQSELGTGGMATKLEAARAVTRAGIECVIANGKKKDVLPRILLEGGGFEGTTFKCGAGRYLARKRWIAFSSTTKGEISVDDGARSALKDKNKSLLASGILCINGYFKPGDAVKITDKNGKEFAKGLSNYSSWDLAKIKGMRTSSFKSVLGREGRDEVIHKDNLVLL
ncbi:MAG: glutamate 5-kinase [Candidatus Omnitrophica bacterium]|nr:glutamate 5-kinase [Candidatus Omnitrophota bacterium]